jgi:hypothetical protein
MANEHRALIHWSATQVHRGLPDATELIDPAWLEGTLPRVDEGWSLVCRFESSPATQGNPSVAWVHFMMPAAPHDALRPGMSLHLFERGTAREARVEILS